MKDIDFDELDRAVSSMMAGSSGGDESAKAPEEPGIKSEPATRAPQEEPRQLDSPRDSKQTDRQPRSRLLAVPKRSGRFMDIVHESSDMISGKKVAMPKQRVVVKPVGRIEQPVEEPPVEDSEIADLAEGTDAYSPFVPDVKVDKRPLGEASSFDDGESDDFSGNEMITSFDSDPNNQLPVEPGRQIPDELLNEDLIAIESDAAASEQEQVATKDEVEPEIEDSAGSEDSANSRLGGDSIPLQYAAKPKKSDDDVAGDIFSTESFQPPLAHPAKAKSGWLTVVMIALFIILGVGAGAALYLFVL